jgi:hypothetical protein
LRKLASLLEGRKSIAFEEQAVVPGKKGEDWLVFRGTNFIIRRIGNVPPPAPPPKGEGSRTPLTLVILMI